MSAVPYIENPHLIRDMKTNASLVCTATSFSYPFDYKTAVVPVAFGHGGIDNHAGHNDWLAPRVVTITIVHVYAPGETYKTVTNRLESVLQGNPIELTTQEEDGAIWLWSGLRLQKFDKKLVAGQFARDAEYTLTFIAPDPQQRAAVKPNTLALDTGLYLDDTPVFYLDSDPDNFLLNYGAAQFTQHTIVNSTGIAPDYAPIVDVYGPIVGYIAGYFFDDAGNAVSWSYQQSLAAGEHLRVDAVQQEVTSSLLGPAAYGAFVPTLGTDLWGIVRPGINTFQLSYTSAASPAACTVTWLPRK